MSQAGDRFRSRRTLHRWLGLNRKTGAICDRQLYEGPVRTDPPRANWLLTEEEKARGLVRPVRFTYTCLDCGADNDLQSLGLAEAMARDPGKVDNLYCARCRRYMCTGPRGHFVWKGSTEKVGT